MFQNSQCAQSVPATGFPRFFHFKMCQPGVFCLEWPSGVISSFREEDFNCWHHPFVKWMFGKLKVIQCPKDIIIPP